MHDGKSVMTEWNPDDDLLRSRLMAAVRSICPAWLWDRAEDIVQRSMIAVLKQRERGETMNPLPASYIRKAAYTAMIDEIRRQHRDRHQKSLDEDDSDIQPHSAEPDGERIAESREISREVRDCLSQLPEARRAAVALYLLGEPVPEIAQRLGCDRKRASNLVYRGRTALRRCLENKGIEP